MDRKVAHSFTDARRQYSRDPLAIDLDADGIETLPIPTSGNPILFDHDADGTRTGTGWLKSDDGWLVRDLNGNGLIDSGRELFGVDTRIVSTDTIDGFTHTGERNAFSGFDALRVLDTGAADGSGRGDGVIDSRDAAFAELKVWRDLNGDGVSQDGELSTLAQLGISAISILATPENTDLGNGNSITARAGVVRNGSTSTALGSVGLQGTQAGNLNLADNPFYRTFTDTIPLTAAAKALPEMGGSGWVRDLREAMSLPAGAALTTTVQAFAAATTRAQQLALVDQLLRDWAGSSGKLSNNGRTIDYLSSTTLNVSEGTKTLRYTAMGPLDQANLPLGLQYMQYAVPVEGYMTRDAAGRFDQLTAAGNALLDRKQVLEVFNGQRFLSFDQTVQQAGGSGSSGGGGGGGGVAVDPTVPQRLGTFEFNANQVQFLEQAYTALRESVYAALVMQTRLARYLNTIELQIDETGVRLDTAPLQALLGSTFAGSPLMALQDLAELVRYAGPTVHAVGYDAPAQLRLWVESLPAGSPILQQLQADGLLQFGGAITASARQVLYLGDGAANSVQAGSADDVLDGGNGTDTLGGGAGADYLYGRAGDDQLFGNVGDNKYDNPASGNGDTYDGGAGNDLLHDLEATDNDSYVLARGGGQDRVRDWGGAGDRIAVGAGVTAAQLTVRRNANDEMLFTLDTGERIAVENGVVRNGATDSYAIETLTLADGTVWDGARIRQEATRGTAGSDVLLGFAGNDEVIGNAGNDVLAGMAGADTLLGGDGDDQLYGNTSNNDYSNGTTGNGDTYDGGAGNDQLYDLEATDNDSYILARGGGLDTVRDWGGTGDRIAVGAGVTAAQLTVRRNANDEMLFTLDTGERIAVENGVVRNGATDSYAIETLALADGTVWDGARIRQEATRGTAGNDVLLGFAGNDEVIGNAGNDMLAGMAGADTLLGGDGDDQLYGNTSNNDYSNGTTGNADTYDGGAGNDLLYDLEATDNDSYILARGGGLDTVRDWGGIGDRIAVGAGVSMSQLTVRRNANDHLVFTLDTGESITVENGVVRNGATDTYAIETLTLADGTVWDGARIRQEATKGTAGTDLLLGFAGSDDVLGMAGNDVLMGMHGADTLRGGDGDDQLYGNTSNNDYSNGTTGNGDTYDGGAGNDLLCDLEATDNDSYILARGGGLDTVRDWGGTGDRIAVGAGASATQVTVRRTLNNELTFTLDTGERILVESAISGSGASEVYAIESLALADGTVWNGTRLRQEAARGTAGNDVLVGSSSADEVLGQAGDDALFAQDGGDILDGGAGQDTLDGGAGNNTYRFGKGDGQDVVLAVNDATAGKLNTVLFKSGVLPAEVVARRVSDGGWESLELAIAGTSDRITVRGFFQGDNTANPYNPVQQVKFADGTTWNLATILSKAFAGTAGADTIAGTTSADTINGQGGNDSLFGRDGNDTLNGGADADALFGEGGADTLDGGPGNDSLTGGTGNNTYRFGKGDGHDIVNSLYDATAGKLSTVLFKTGVLPSEVVARRVYDSGWESLELSITGTSDKITVRGFFFGDNTANPENPVQQVKFADGTTWNLATILSKLFAGTAGADEITGTTAADTINGQAGADTLYGRAGNDTLNGGADADALFGEAGNDTLDGGAGNDSMTGGAGNNTYRFGKGDGQDIVNGFHDATAGKLNTVLFKTGVLPSEVVVRRISDSGWESLELSITGTTDKLTVRQFFFGNNPANAYNPVQQVKFADGTTWNLATLQTKAAASAPQSSTEARATAQSAGLASESPLAAGPAGLDDSRVHQQLSNLIQALAVFPASPADDAVRRPRDLQEWTTLAVPALQ